MTVADLMGVERTVMGRSTSTLRVGRGLSLRIPNVMAFQLVLQGTSMLALYTIKEW